MRAWILIFGLLLAPAAALAQPATLTISDPPAGQKPAPQMVALQIQSSGQPMNAVYYLAGGPGPHPTVLLLHGFPGNEQNLDLAQAMRRAGWNVLTFHYRGSWGSGGSFSFTHVLEDANAALGFLRNPEAAKTFNADRERIVVVGHSMGGLAAAHLARRNPALTGVGLIDAANMGKAAAGLKLLPGAARAPIANRIFGDLGPLAGTSPTALADELADHNADFDYLPWAPEIARVPSLVIGATGQEGRAKEGAALAEAMRKAGGKVTAVEMAADHSFSDHRVALPAAVLDWLAALPRR
jgi:pimeloyl-ACP methyl ester carboxylesterase